MPESARIYCLLLLLSFNFLACQTISEAPAQAAQPDLQIELAPVNSRILLLTGLNNSDASLEPLARRLRAAGAEVATLELGAQQGPERFSVTASTWLEKYKAEFLKFQALAPQKPVSVIGFSTGALLAWLQGESDPAINYHKQVLIAPPFELRFTSQLVRLLLPLKFMDISLPARTPAPYRINDGTSLQAYSALFALRELAFKQLEQTPAQQNPGLLVLNPFDELVCLRQSLKLKNSKHFESWQVYSDFTEHVSHAPDHLMISEEFLNSPAGRKMLLHIFAYLQN